MNIQEQEDMMRYQYIQNNLVNFKNVLNNSSGTLVSSNTLLSRPWDAPSRACALLDILKLLLRVFEQEGGHVG